MNINMVLTLSQVHQALNRSQQLCSWVPMQNSHLYLDSTATFLSFKLIGFTWFCSSSNSCCCCCFLLVVFLLHLSCFFLVLCTCMRVFLPLFIFLLCCLSPFDCLLMCFNCVWVVFSFVCWCAFRFASVYLCFRCFTLTNLAILAFQAASWDMYYLRLRFM